MAGATILFGYSTLTQLFFVAFAPDIAPVASILPSDRKAKPGEDRDPL